MQIADMIQLAQEIGEFKPVVQKVFDGLKLYKDEWEDITTFFAENTVKFRSKIFKGFLEEGFTREEAMTLTIATIKDIQQGFNNAKQTKGEIN